MVNWLSRLGSMMKDWTTIKWPLTPKWKKCVIERCDICVWFVIRWGAKIYFVAGGTKYASWSYLIWSKDFWRNPCYSFREDRGHSRLIKLEQCWSSQKTETCWQTRLKLWEIVSDKLLVEDFYVWRRRRSMAGPLDLAERKIDDQHKRGGHA